MLNLCLSGERVHKSESQQTAVEFLFLLLSKKKKHHVFKNIWLASYSTVQAECHK